MSKQPEALRLADAIADACLMDGISRRQHLDERLLAAAELRRLHSLNAKLVDALEDLFGADMEHVLMGDGKDDQIAALAKASAALAKAKEAQQ